jgi:hypothetical protein
MKKMTSLGCFLTFLLCTYGISNAVVLNFDNITNGTGWYVLNSSSPNYGGMTWDNDFELVHRAYFQGNYANTYSFPSGNYAVYNSDGVSDVSLSLNGRFDFTGAYFAGWGESNSNAWYTSTSITVRGYASSAMVGSFTISLSANQFNWMQADIIGVDRLVFESTGNDQYWIMDNLTLKEPAPVPEPKTVLLLSSGLAGFVGFRKRLNKS